MLSGNANEDQVNAFRAYIDRQVAANQAFVSKLISAKDLPEAMQIQVEYFQSQMRAAVNDTTQLTDRIATSSQRSRRAKSPARYGTTIRRRQASAANRVSARAEEAAVFLN